MIWTPRGISTVGLGCPEGRSSAHWIDFDLFGHQIVAHHTPRSRKTSLEGNAQPHTRFEGLAGEQSTTLFLDPAGNALEFKAFRPGSTLRPLMVLP